MKMNGVLIIIFASIFITSCSNNNRPNNMKSETTDFKWNVQLAGYDYDKYDEKGKINYNDFIREFDKFPWIEQIEKYQKIQQGCSATMSVQDEKNQKSFWVSIMGNKTDNTFLVGYVYPKKKKGLFGFGKEKEIKWLEIYIAENSEKVKKCFDYYFQRDYANLENTLHGMEKYSEMEAQN